MKATLTKNEALIKSVKGWLIHHCGITSQSIKLAEWYIRLPNSYQQNIIVNCAQDDMRLALVEAKAKMGKPHYFNSSAATGFETNTWYFPIPSGDVGCVKIAMAKSNGTFEHYGEIYLSVIAKKDIAIHSCIPKSMKDKFLNSESEK